MVEALRTRENGTPEELLDAVNRSVAAFVGKAPQFDDLTMLCVTYNGPEAEKADGKYDGKYVADRGRNNTERQR